MHALRQHLGRLVGAVLTLHVCFIAAAPTMLYLDLRTAITECTCPQGDGGACPMHHNITSSAEKHTCTFRSAADSRNDAIIALLGPVAVLASAVTTERVIPSVLVTLADSQSFNTFSVPEAPPPRP